MSYACPVDLDLARLRREIQSVYARVAGDPGGAFHFHRGPVYAAERLGYDAAELAALPAAVTEAFAGIGNPHAIARIPEGATVVDVGCGAGMDLLLSARRAGPSGAAIGVDMTDDMLDRARGGARGAGLSNVELRQGDATALPLADASVDVVTSNGVLNLVPDKPAAAADMFRVLKPGGRLQIADIIVAEALSDDVRRDVDLWTGWIGGALPAAELADVLAGAGFSRIEFGARFDCFAGTTKERTARKYGVLGVNVSAMKA